jgi:hypothetical protein
MHIKSAKTIALEQKNLAFRKIYIPELTALTVAPSNQIGVGHYGVVGRWRAGVGNRSAIVATPI